MSRITAPCPRCGRLMRFNRSQTRIVCTGADIRVPSTSSPYRLIPACGYTAALPEDIRLRREGNAPMLPGFD